jgi:AcrR family transcriptional regulator
VSVALELIGHEGLGACNMRRLASDLGVAPMSIYYHVPSKSDLLDAVADAAIADIRLPRDDLEWADAARMAGYEARRVARRYPELLQTLFDQSRPAVVEFSQRCIEICMNNGFNHRDSWTAIRTIGRYVIGTVMGDLRELRAHGFTAGTLSVPEDEWLRGPGAESLERSFDRGLSVIIGGLELLRHQDASATTS